jgi:hypothetical protein
MQAVSFPGSSPGLVTTGPFTSTIYGEAPSDEMLRLVDIQQHDPDLVRIIDERKPDKPVKFTMSTPFANKDFCLPAYERSLSHIPTKQAHAVFYDNSNSDEMRQELRRILETHFDSWTLIEDRNKAQTFESNVDLPEYARITHRVAAVYATLFPDYLADADIVFNLEDDVEIAAGDFERLWDTIHLDDRIATVIGNQRDRRTGYASTGHSIAFNFTERIQVGCSSSGDEMQMKFATEKTFGIEAIGAGHTGCWMTRRNALDSIYIGDERYRGLTGADICWGLRVNHANRLFVINWQVNCKHWFKRFGKAVCM